MGWNKKTGAIGMIKEFFIDENRKKKLKKLIMEASDKYLWIKKSICILNALVVIFPLLFLVYAYFISDAFVQLHDRYAPVGTKNHWFIITVTVVIFIMTFFLKLIMNTIYAGLAEQKLDGRFAETLIYNNGVIEYGYKNHMQATMHDRVIVKIPLAEIDMIYYDSNEEKITFEGNISSLYYDNYEEGYTRGQEKYIKTSFELWDYFVPGLKSFLDEIGINIIKN